MTSKQINSKTIARIASIQVIYQYEFTGVDINIILNGITEFYKNPDLKYDYEISQGYVKIKPSNKHLTRLVDLIYQNLADIDAIIAGYLDKDWLLSDLPPLARAILRAAVTELKFFPEVSYKIIVNEYTDIAGDMLTLQEVGFINSLLDNYSKNK